MADTSKQMLDRRGFEYFVEEEHAYLKRYIAENVPGLEDVKGFVKQIRVEFDATKGTYTMSYMTTYESGNVFDFGDVVKSNIDKEITDLNSYNLPTSQAVVDYIRNSSANAVVDVYVDEDSVLDSYNIAQIPNATAYNYGVTIIGIDENTAFSGYTGNWIYDKFNKTTGEVKKAIDTTYITDEYGHRLSYADLAGESLVGRGIEVKNKRIQLNDAVVGTYVLEGVSDIPKGFAEILIDTAYDGFLYFNDTPDAGFKVHGIINNTNENTGISIDVPSGDIYGTKYINLGLASVNIPVGQCAEMTAVNIGGNIYIKVTLTNEEKLSKYAIFYV